MNNAKNRFLDLKKYELLYSIGEGAFGRVYRVKDRTNDKYYAAKVSLFLVDEDTKDSPVTLSLFREVNLMSLLNHPAILKFIGYSQTNFEDDLMPTIITEFATNGSLKSIIQLESQGLSPKEWDSTMKLINIYGIASGMSYMHKHNVLHRDLKPENILIDDYLHPKIADFGLSKINDIISVSMNFQSQSGPKGTFLYMAPESVCDENYSKAGDVYAFALIVYELLTGITPFATFSMKKILTKVVNGGYRPKIEDDVPNAFKELIEKCWSQKPEDRPSFDSIMDELKTNSEFINELIDESQFLDYVDFVDNYQTTFNLSNRLTNFDEFIKIHGRNKDAKKVVINKNDDSDDNELNEEEKYVSKDKLTIEEDKNEIIKITDENEDKVKIENDVNATKNKDDNNMKVINDEENPAKIIEDDNTSKIIKEDNTSKIIEDNNTSKIIKEGNTTKIIEEDNSSKIIDDDNSSKIIEEDNSSKIIEEDKTLKNKDDKEEEYNLIYPKFLFNELNKQCQNLVIEAQNRPEKQYLLGKSLIEGEDDFPQNIKYGLQYLDKSISSKYKKSLFYYTQMLIKGELISQDLVKAKEYLSFINDPTDPLFLILSGKIYLKEKKYNKAKSFFEKGVKLEDPKSIYEYAKFIFIRESKKNVNEAIKYFELAKEKGFEKSRQFLLIYKEMNSNIKKFNSLQVETQYLIISKIIKANRIQNNKYFTFSEILIGSQKTEMLFFNNSLKSTVFFNCLAKFQNILFEIEYPSNQFEQIHDLISKLKKKKLKQLNIIIVVSSFKELNLICNSKKLNICRISSSIKEIIFKSFENCSTLEKIIIPSSVTGIGYSSFKGCSSLNEIKISSSVTSIGNNAFSGCTSLAQIKIPSSVTFIGNYAFEGCSSLTQIEIPPSVIKIGKKAFNNCPLFKQIKIPSSVTELDESFSNCSSLKQITFTTPSSLTSIGENAFYKCSSLTKITIPPTVVSIGFCAFSECSSLAEVDIPSSVTKIEDFAFSDCSSLTQIEIPPSVTSIGNDAFKGCSKLTQILFLTPSSVTQIGDHAFSDCSSLTQIEIPPSITSIGVYSFCICSSLTQISVPSSLKCIKQLCLSSRTKIIEY